MEQVAGQQTRCRVCVAWYKTSQSRFPSPPSFTRTGSLPALSQHQNPPNFFFKETFSAAVPLLSVPIFRGQTQMWVNSVRGLQDISAATDAQSGCRKKKKTESLITITILDENSEAALRRSWQRWQTGADKKEARKGLKISVSFLSCYTSLLLHS